MKYRIVYGKDYIAIKKNKKELLYWTEQEWIDEPQVVFSICNAIELAYKDKLEKTLSGFYQKAPFEVVPTKNR